MTASPSDFQWPMRPGYYEIMGTPEPKQRSFKALEDAQRLVNAGNRIDAIAHLRGTLSQKNENPDLAFALCRLLSAVEDHSFTKETERYAEKFPRDLRFGLLLAVRDSADEKKKERWDGLLTHLEQGSIAERNFFRADVVRYFLQMAAKDISYLELAPRMLALYPDLPELRYELAMLFEKSGDAKEAEKHLRWLVARQREVEAGKDFFTKYDGPYLQAWREGLRGRFSG